MVDRFLDKGIELIEEVASIFQSLPQAMEQFETSATVLPREMLKVRLLWQQSGVMMASKQLWAEHEGEGYVTVHAGHGVLDVRWSEIDLLESRRWKRMSMGGYLTVPEVITQHIDTLLSQVEKDIPRKVLHWLRQTAEVRIEGVEFFNGDSLHIQTEYKPAGGLFED